MVSATPPAPTPATRTVTMTESFAIAPGGGRPLWLLVPIGLVLLGAFALLVASLGDRKSVV